MGYFRDNIEKLAVAIEEENAEAFKLKQEARKLRKSKRKKRSFFRKLFRLGSKDYDA